MSNDGCPMPDEAEVDPIVLGPIGLGLGSAKADMEEVSFSLEKIDSSVCCSPSGEGKSPSRSIESFHLQSMPFSWHRRHGFSSLQRR